MVLPALQEQTECFLKGLQTLRLQQVKVPASKMSDFNFDEILREPTVTTYPTPPMPKDDEGQDRIGEIVTLIRKFRDVPRCVRTQY